MVTSKAARDYKAYVGRRMLDRKVSKVPAPYPVCVQISWYRERKSGDLDKRIGIVLDALQGVLFDDDSQVVAINAERWEDPKRPRVEIIVIPMPLRAPQAPAGERT
jgi:Holliday junction resolvase RusA-like endonuclease